MAKIVSQPIVSADEIRAAVAAAGGDPKTDAYGRPRTKRQRKSRTPGRPGPKPSTTFVTSRNALLAAALSAGFDSFDALAQHVGIYRENMSKIANGWLPVSAQVEAKLREVLPDADKWLSTP